MVSTPGIVGDCSNDCLHFGQNFCGILSSDLNDCSPDIGMATGATVAVMFVRGRAVLSEDSSDTGPAIPVAAATIVLPRIPTGFVVTLQGGSCAANGLASLQRNVGARELQPKRRKPPSVIAHLQWFPLGYEARRLATEAFVAPASLLPSDSKSDHRAPDAASAVEASTGLVWGAAEAVVAGSLPSSMD